MAQGNENENEMKQYRNPFVIFTGVLHALCVLLLSTTETTRTRRKGVVQDEFYW